MYFKKISYLFLIAVLVIVSGQSSVICSQDKNLQGKDPGEPVNVQNSLVKARYIENLQNISSPEIVERIWRDICALNRDVYPDSNLVLPGQTIKLPLGKFYIAKAGGNDHMWQASIFFTNEYVMPYLYPRDPVMPKDSTSADTVLSNTTTTTDNTGLIYLILALVFFLILAVLMAIKNRNSRVKAEDKLEKERNRQPVINPPFVKKENIPSFHHVSDFQLTSLANKSLEHLYKNFTTIGTPIKGLINGKGVNYFKSGSKRKETFKNKEGYKVRIRFEDGREENVYSLYSCCNPLWGLVHSDTNEITFTPLTTMNPEPIPTVPAERVAEITEVLKGEKEKYSSPIGKIKISEKTEKTQPGVDPGFLTKVSLPNHVTFEGNIPFDKLSVKLIKELLQAANNTGKNNKDEKKDSNI